MPWLPTLQQIEHEAKHARARDRRNFRRDVVLRVLPEVIRNPSLSKRNSPIELAFEIAEACVQLDAHYAREDRK